MQGEGVRVVLGWGDCDVTEGFRVRENWEVKGVRWRMGVSGCSGWREGVLEVVCTVRRV